MRLVVSTPLAVVVDTDLVRHLRAEDASGAFGILSGHADFLTALDVSVITWQDGRGAEHHVAVRGGMLAVEQGHTISVATREAVADDDLRRLEDEVLAVFRRRHDDELRARLDAQRLYLNAIRQIYRHLRPQQPASSSPVFGAGPGSPP